MATASAQVQTNTQAGPQAAQNAAAPNPAAQPASAPIAKIQAALSSPQPDVSVAAIAAEHANDWNEIAAYLQKQAGNGFVAKIKEKLAESKAQNQYNHLSSDQRTDLDTMLARGVAPDAALSNAAMSRPLSAADHEALQTAIAKLASVKPTPINPGKDPNQVQIEVSFDGTWDNKDNAALETNPAIINDLFEGTKIYEKGVGTGGGLDTLVGGVFGAGISDRIDDAYNQLVTDINAAHQSNPNAQVVLVVCGFSRGAAAARAFVNTLNKRGIPDTSSKQADGSYSRQLAGPRIGAMMLFDTVGSVGVPGTNLNPGLDLSIPANAENVLQLTADDEHRRLFPLNSVQDPTRPNDPRIAEIGMPGAHSDVGGGYPNGYSQVSLAMADDYLRRAGVNIAPVAMPDTNDPSLRLHDSGGGDNQRTVYPSKNPT